MASGATDEVVKFYVFYPGDKYELNIMATEFVPTLTGVDDIKADGVSVKCGEGYVEITGAENAAIYNMGGVIVANCVQRHYLTPGIYIVNADGQTSVVTVK